MSMKIARAFSGPTTYAGNVDKLDPRARILRSTNINHNSRISLSASAITTLSEDRRGTCWTRCFYMEKKY